MANVRSYILSIVAVAVICAIIKTLLTDKTTIGMIAKLLCGIFMTTTIIAPVTQIRFYSITDYFEDLSTASDIYVKAGKAAADDHVSGIIKSQVEAYILDKANHLGLNISLEVELDDSNYKVPCGVKIQGTVPPYAKEVMSAYMEDSLGIARENQLWM